MSYVPPSMRNNLTRVFPEPLSNNDTKTYFPPVKLSPVKLPPVKSTTINVNPKTINTDSIEEFPPLGSPSSIQKTKDTQNPSMNFANMAKAWATKDSLDRQQKESEELRRVETERQQYLITRRPRVHEQQKLETYGTSMADEIYNDDQKYSTYDEQFIDNTTSYPSAPVSNPLGIRSEDYEF